MNKIYKVVWSKAKHCYVVVSELAKNHTKGCGRRSLRRTAVSLGIVAALLGGFSGSAWAELGAQYIDEAHSGVSNGITVITGDSNALDRIVKTNEYGNINIHGIVYASSITVTGLTIGTTAVDTAGLTGAHTIASGSTGYVSGATVNTKLADYTKNSAAAITGGSISGVLVDATSLKINGSAVDATGLTGNHTIIGDGGTGYVTGATVGTELANYAKADASNITVSDWATKLGAGTIASDSVSLVKGSTVYDYLNGATLALGANSTNIAIGKGNSIPTSQIPGDTPTDRYNTVIGYNNKIADFAGDSEEASNSASLNVFGANNKILGSSNSIVIGNNIQSNYGSSGDDYANSLFKDNNDILLGNNVYISQKVNYGIGIGENVQLISNNAIAIGSYENENSATTASGDSAIAIGSRARASAHDTGGESVALGAGAYAYGDYTTAIGASANAGSETTGPAPYATAVGRYSQALMNYAIAIGGGDQSGFKSLAATASEKYSIAMGYRATASKQNAIAIGSGTNSSDGNQAGATASGDSAIAIGDSAEAATGYTIAMGTNAKVASGTGTIAIGYNASASGNDTATAIGFGATSFQGTAIGWSANANGAGATALGGFANANSEYATAVGLSAKATSINAVAIGRGAEASRVDSENPSIYLSTESATALGAFSKAQSDYATAVGTFAKATALNAIAIGGGELEVNDTDPENVIITYKGAAASAANAIAIGYQAKATISDSVALGSDAVTTRGAYATTTYNAYLNEDGSKTLDTADSATKNAWRSTHSAVAVGNDATVTRQITGVAAGSADTDAVNVAQLKEATPVIKDAHNYYDGSETAVKVTDAVNAVDKALGKVAAGSNYLTEYNETTPTGTFADNLKALDTAAGTFRDKIQNITAVENTTTMKGVLNVSDPTSETTGVSINGTAKTITAGGIAIDGANNTLKVGGDSGIILSNATTGNTLKVGGITISDNGTAKTITGLSNTSTTVEGFGTVGRAATEEQLIAVTTSLKDGGLKFTANSGGPVTNKLGSTIGVVGSAVQDGHIYSASNITTEIVQNAGDSTITVKMDDNPTFASMTATGKVQGASLTDGTATLQGGALSGVTNITATGNVTLGSGTNTVTISGGAVTATGNISGKDIMASGMLSSATLKVGGVDVTTPLTTVGKVESGNAGFVTGGTVYSEVRPAANGNYVKTANTTAVNLTALDSAIGSVAADGNYIKASATSNVAQNLTALDTQVKTNADNIAALQSSTTASVGTIATDGNYIKKSDTNNVSQNLIALDTQMKTNADNIAANKAAIGTTADGSYVKAAETVGRNLNALDTQVKTNTDDIATLKNSISVQEDASGTKTTTIDGNLVIKEQDGTTKDVTAALTTEGEVAKQGETGSEGYLKGETVYDYLNKGENGKEVKLAKESKQIAVGRGSVASGVESIAIGNETGGQRNEATGLQSIAIGFGNQVTGAHSGAIGDPTYIAADNSYAMGNSNNITATGARSFAIGNNNTISGSDTFVLGSNVNTNASNAVVLGNNSVGEDGAVSVGSVGNERQIKHVAPGTDANDAATVGQVAALAQNTTTVINRVDSKLNKVGAGAAALAALHPLDTDDKFTMGMGYGNYRNSHAAAIGMFYRPTDKVMISMSGTMGNGENMFNAGISFALDKGKGFSTSKAAMARKIAAQEEKISEQDAKIQSLAAENAKLAERLAAIEAKLSK